MVERDVEADVPGTGTMIGSEVMEAGREWCKER